MALGHTATLGGLYVHDVSNDSGDSFLPPIIQVAGVPFGMAPTDLYVSDALVYVLGDSRTEMFVPAPDGADACCIFADTGGVAIAGMGPTAVIADFDGSTLHVVTEDGVPPSIMPTVTRTIANVSRPVGLGFGNQPLLLSGPLPTGLFAPMALYVTSANGGVRGFDTATWSDLPPMDLGIPPSIHPWSLVVQGGTLVFGLHNANGASLGGGTVGLPGGG